jgi:hypothetical protein
MELSELKQHWAALSNVPTVENGDAEHVIDAPFLHFAHGTPIETIWRWFEAQHPGFSVAVSQGHTLYMAMELFGQGATERDRVLCENGRFLDEWRVGMDSPKFLSSSREKVLALANAAGDLLV